MDRNNLHCVEEVSGDTVALRKESVDRNQVCVVTGRLLQVALRKESVDRNDREVFGIPYSAVVALRKESVDRNCYHRDDVPD